MEGIKNLVMISTVIVIILVSLIIYILKNQKEIEKNFNSIKHKNIIKILIIIICLLIICVYSYKCVKEIKIYFTMYKGSKETYDMFNEFDDKLKQEEKFYKSAIQKEYNINNEPYIPENFEYVEGDLKSGFVIQDKDKNQYVWIPCTNKENENIVKLQKKDFYIETGIRYFDCLNSEYEEFIESSLENGGFYISRFEIGKEGENIVSKSGVPVLSHISRKDMIENVNKMYGTINCRLINGYAYDTALEWIEKNNNIEIGKYDFDKEKNILTGRVKYNNIYDFTDNVMEITTEDFYDTIIYRGFDYRDDFELDSRYNLLEENVSKLDERLKLLAFRTILYK